MRAFAKASSEGSIEGAGGSRSLFGRASATRDASLCFNGSGTPSIARLGALLALGLTTLLALATPSAFAAPVTLKTFTGPGTGNGQLEEPGRLAIERSTGNLIVADAGNDRVQVFNPEGEYLTQLNTGLSHPYGVAVYESGGQTVVYVSNAGNQTIAKFNSDEAAVPSFTPAAGFTSPAAGVGAGQVGDFEAGIATDPTSGDLLVADRANHRISRYQADGTFLSSFEGADSGSSFTVPLDVAVDSTGDILVVDSTGGLKELMGGENYGYIPAPTSRVLRFSSAGVYEVQIGGSLRTPGLVTVDPVNDQVVVVGQFDAVTIPAPSHLTVNVFASDGSPVGGTGTLTGAYNPLGAGVGVVGGASYRIYALTGINLAAPAYGAVGGQILENVDAPTAAIDPATDVSFFSATLNGRVDPHGTETSYVFENSTNGIDFSPVGPPQSAGAGNGDVPVSAHLTGLADSGIFTYRLVATNPGGSETSSVEYFFTEDAEVPAVTLGAATEITKTDATLHGTVDAEGVPTTYRFEYSIDDGANWTPAPVPDADAGEGADPVNVETTIAGLDPNTVVRYRLAAKNGAGTTTSAPDQSFTTIQDAPGVVTGIANDRARTSATLHGSVNPFGLQSTFHFEYGLTTDYGLRAPRDLEPVAGNGHKALGVENIITDLQPGATYHYRLVAANSIGEAKGEDRTFTTRSAAAEPRIYEQVSPVNKGGSNVATPSGTVWQSSPDGNAFSYIAKTAFAGEVASPAGPLKPRYLARRGADWSSIAVDPPQLPSTSRPEVTAVLGISEDLTKEVVVSLKKLATGAVEGDSNVYLFDTTTGEYTTIVTVPGTLFNYEAIYVDTYIFVDGTPDFSHVLISSRTFPLVPGAPGKTLYEWTNGELRIASIAPGGSPIGGIISGSPLYQKRDPHYISDDGSRVFVNVEQNGPVYVRENGTTTTPISESQRAADPPGTIRNAHFGGASRDGRFAFILSSNLTDDSPPGASSLYRHDVVSGETVFIGSGVTGLLEASEDGAYVYFEAGGIHVWHEGQVSDVAPFGTNNQWRASPNGKFLAFGSGQRIYRYDAESDALACASCRPDGRKPLSTADISYYKMDFGGRHFPRSVLDNGEVFFDTRDPLVAADVNSSRDVYSFDGQEATLISAGTGLGDSQFEDASADGKNVFFTTQDQLVRQDTDPLIDLYDARIGGGIASQNPPPPRGECIRDDCKATPNVGPELPFGGSEGLSGPGNVAAPARPRCGKGRHKQKVKGKARCVKPHKKRAKSNRRQGR